MAKFYLPLAATSMLMMASHSIVSSGLARTSNAAASLAAFAVAQSLAVMFESPCYTIQRMCVALFKDKGSYSAVKHATIIVWAALTVVMLAIAFTPLSRFAFLSVLKVPEELYVDALRSFRVFLVLPAFSAFRSFYQGLLIIRKRTSQLTTNMAFRLLIMFALATLLPRLNLSGGAVGALILSAGIGTEGLMAFFTARKIGNTLPNEGPSMSPSRALWFFLPLAVASITSTFIRPVVNAGLARTVDPALALASYQVAWSFSYIFAAVAFNIHQLAIVFAKNTENRLSVFKFAMLMGGLGSLVLLIVAVTPIGPLALTRIIGVSDQIASEALGTIALLSLMPILTCISEYCAGLLIIANQTRYLTAGKLVNLFFIIALSLLITRYAPHLGSRLAGICMVGGIGAEAAFVAQRTRAVVFGKDTLIAAGS